MHRRKVDLPEPEGPSMHMTWPRLTSRSMPLRTSSRPNRLCTPSALTIGPLIGHRFPPPIVSHRAHSDARSARVKPRP